MSSSSLSEGGRALSKHCVRPENDGFWGPSELTGTSAHKNELARAKLQILLDEAIWLNVHSMPPHTEICFEIRVLSGHGARWTWIPESGWTCMFRGFLDPTGVRMNVTAALASCEGVTKSLQDETNCMTN